MLRFFSKYVNSKPIYNREVDCLCPTFEIEITIETLNFWEATYGRSKQWCPDRSIKILKTIQIYQSFFPSYIRRIKILLIVDIHITDDIHFSFFHISNLNLNDGCPIQQSNPSFNIHRFTIYCCRCLRLFLDFFFQEKKFYVVIVISLLILYGIKVSGYDGIYVFFSSNYPRPIIRYCLTFVHCLILNISVIILSSLLPYRYTFFFAWDK